MKHIQQDGNECWLATACMLADADIKKVRAMIKKEFGWSWNSISKYSTTCSSFVYWKGACQFVLKVLGLPDEAVPYLTINLSGKGTIIIHKPNQEEGHAVAYENWTIYDPARKKPEKWGTWLSDIYSNGYELARIKPLTKLEKD